MGAPIAIDRARFMVRRRFRVADPGGGNLARGPKVEAEMSSNATET
jgi:hypothetical protein